MMKRLGVFLSMLTLLSSCEKSSIPDNSLYINEEKVLEFHFARLVDDVSPSTSDPVLIIELYETSFGKGFPSSGELAEAVFRQSEHSIGTISLLTDSNLLNESSPYSQSKTCHVRKYQKFDDRLLFDVSGEMKSGESYRITYEGPYIQYKY